MLVIVIGYSSALRIDILYRQAASFPFDVSQFSQQNTMADWDLA